MKISRPTLSKALEHEEQDKQTHRQTDRQIDIHKERLTDRQMRPNTVPQRISRVVKIGRPSLTQVWQSLAAVVLVSAAD